MGSNSGPSDTLLHALVIPLPLQSHIIPMMHLAEKLSSAGLIVTFVTTHHTHSQITKAHSNSNSNRSTEVDPIHLRARNLGLDIRSAQISDGLPFNFDRSGRFLDHMRSMENMGEELKNLIQSLNKTGIPISCVIADPILYWSLDVTKKFGIPWISFWTQSTIVYSIYYHVHLLEAHNRGTGKILIDYIPGVPTLQLRDLPSFFHDRDADSEYALGLVLKAIHSSRRADWILCNSFDDLESPTVKAMNLQPPVLHVGPLLPSGYLKGENYDKGIKIGTSFWAEYDGSAWLDTKPKDSVIYVSFGSMIRLSKAQVEEIAMGLKDSGQPFLWVLRPDIVIASDCAGLPDGFLHEMGITGPQGLVVPWCNQLRVLSHPSVGGIITHCGWNSMLESIAHGVPLLGFPVWSEQYTNCVLMADVWKIGLRLRGCSRTGDMNNLIIVREDISKAIKKLFTDEGKEIEKNVKALRDSARTAILEGGSSQKNIENFVEGLKARNAFTNSIEL